MWGVQQVCGWLKAHLLTFAALHHPIFLLGLVVDWVAAARWCLLGDLEWEPRTARMGWADE